MIGMFCVVLHINRLSLFLYGRVKLKCHFFLNNGLPEISSVCNRFETTGLPEFFKLAVAYGFFKTIHRY